MNSKKRKERKQIITLVISAVVILLLVVLYAVIMNETKGDDEDESTELELMDIGTFTVIEENYAYMTKLSYTRYGQTIDLEVKNGEWILSDDEDFPLDMQKVIYMTQAISDYGGYRRIEYKESSFDTYGFNDPEFVFVATYYETDGEETYTRKYYFGAKNELTGYYYFYEEGADYVYMVSNALISYFDYTKTDLFKTETVPCPELEDIDSVEVTIDGGEAVLLEVPEAAATENEDGTINYSAVEVILDTFNLDIKLKYDTCVKYAISEDDLEDYGLVSPALKIAMDFTSYESVSTEDGTSGAQIARDDSFTILFGDTFVETAGDEDDVDEVEYVYMTVLGSDIVYKLRTSHYADLITAVKGEIGE